MQNEEEKPPKLSFGFLTVLAIIGFLSISGVVFAFTNLSIVSHGHVVPTQPPAVNLFVSSTDVPAGTDCSQAVYSDTNSLSIDYGNVTPGQTYTRYYCVENIGNQPYTVNIEFTGSQNGIQIGNSGLSMLPPGTKELVTQTI